MSPLIGLYVTLLVATPVGPAATGAALTAREPAVQARYEIALHQFAEAIRARDANEAARALDALDELRPREPRTLRARAELAELRGDEAARERALRDLMASDPRAPGAASALVDSLLQLRRPAAALAVAQHDAPERLASDGLLQAYERNWVNHVELAAEWRHREGDRGFRGLDAPHVQLALVFADDRWGRLRMAADAYALDSGLVPVGSPYGSSTALPAVLRSDQQVDGVGFYLHLAARPGMVLEVGHSAQNFPVRNLLGALRFQGDFTDGPLALGFERAAVTDSQLSFAGTVDPATGRSWGGVVSNRAYLEGRWGGAGSGIYGSVATALLSGHQVADNAEWEAELGFWRQAISGNGWSARLGANVTALAFTDNLSRFTLGHGGYFSPQRFVSAGPTFDLQGQAAGATFRIEGGLSWQNLREDASHYFPDHPQLQAGSGNLVYGASSSEGLGGRLAATVEWRVSSQAVAGLRLEGVSGEDYEEVRLQVYARRWQVPVSESLREPPRAILPVDFYDRY